MMDTEASRGIADSLPLTSLALNHALLRWGLFDSAMAKVGFYFKSFVYANGTIDMGHCKIVILSRVIVLSIISLTLESITIAGKDKWADLGDGQYVSAEMVFRPEFAAPVLSEVSRLPTELHIPRRSDRSRTDAGAVRRHRALHAQRELDG